MSKDSSANYYQDNHCVKSVHNQSFVVVSFLHLD